MSGTRLGREEGRREGFDARLHSVFALFFVASVAVLLVSDNTPLRFNEGIGEGDRVGLNAVAVLMSAATLGILAFPRQRFGRNAFAVVPAPGTVAIAFVVAFSGAPTASGTGSLS